MREARGMAIKGCKSIAEYKFRRWMQEHGFVEGYYTLDVDRNRGAIRGRNREALELVYDSESKCVEVR